MNWISHFLPKRTKINPDANIEFLLSHIEFLTERVEELELKLHQVKNDDSENVRVMIR